MVSIRLSLVSLYNNGLDNMIHTYLTLEYISIVLFGLILILFSVGSTYLNFEKDNKTNGGDVEYKSWKQKKKEYNKVENRNEN